MYLAIWVFCPYIQRSLCKAARLPPCLHATWNRTQLPHFQVKNFLMFFQFFFFLFVIVVLAFLPSLAVYISTLKSFQVNAVFFVCQEGWCKKLINCEIHPASQQKQLHTIKFLLHVIINFSLLACKTTEFIYSQTF